MKSGFSNFTFFIEVMSNEYFFHGGTLEIFITYFDLQYNF